MATAHQSSQTIGKVRDFDSQVGIIVSMVYDHETEL